MAIMFIFRQLVEEDRSRAILHLIREEMVIKFAKESNCRIEAETKFGEHRVEIIGTPAKLGEVAEKLSKEGLSGFKVFYNDSSNERDELWALNEKMRSFPMSLGGGAPLVTE